MSRTLQEFRFIATMWLRVKAGGCPELGARRWSDPGDAECHVMWRGDASRYVTRHEGGGRWTLPLPYYLSRVTIVNCNVSDKMCCVTTESMLAAMADCSVTVCCLCGSWNHQLPSRIVASSCGWGTEDTDQKFDGKYWNLINTTPTFVLRHTTQY